MRPALTWTIALGGLLLLAGAMAWATHSLMGMERRQQRMEVEAAVQERVRLALWRMESIAATLVVEESARPPDQYRTDPADAPPVSPESRIRLHFEMDPDGRVRSPQAASGPDKAVVPDEPARRLQEIRARLAESAGPGQWALLGKLPHGGGQESNSMWLLAANGPPVTLLESRPDDAASEKSKAQKNDSAAPPAPSYAPPQLASAMKPADAIKDQNYNNEKEAEMRSRAVEDLARSAMAQRQQEESRLKFRKVGGVAQKPAAAPQAALNRAAEFKLEDKPNSPSAPTEPPAQSNGMAQENTALAAAEVSVQAESDAPPAPVVSDFRALWVQDALLLTRRVSQGGASLIQGAWVEWPQLQSALLASVSDLFPSAALVAAPSGTGGGTDLLAALPIRFLPGRLEVPAPPFWSPLKLSLATAWGCVLLASGAVALVLRGMMLLSERRAAFVSAVTHELRTPLATFKLYSEMLADGLVKDPAKRQSYLETLTTEADRLGHLVENVLAYSRLERGKGSDGQIRTTLKDFLHRVEPRLHQRVATAGAQFSICQDGVPDSFEFLTDPAAVEQILFNLVDNACKYAGGEGAPATLELVINRARASLQLAVRDHGPGLTKGEARKLFRPFHKSAREAAHSAPGVGLGLALCRRLARDLGGTLDIDHTWPHGACFVLTLPLAS